MATIDGKPVDTTLYPTVTRGFQHEEVTVPPKFEIELLGSKVERRTVRYRKGQRVACKTWQEFKELEAKAKAYGGEVQFVCVHCKKVRWTRRTPLLILGLTDDMKAIL